MVKTLKKQKIRFEDTLRFANFFTMALVSFSKGHVIVVSPPYLILKLYTCFDTVSKQVYNFSIKYRREQHGKRAAGYKGQRSRHLTGQRGAGQKARQTVQHRHEHHDESNP